MAFAAAPSTLAGVVRHLCEHGPVVLVGVSRGGVVLNGVGKAVPDLLDRIVYISAWCCVDRTVSDTLPSWSVPLRHSGVPQLNWRTADPGLLATLKRALRAEGADRQFLTLLNTLELDEFRRARESCPAPTPGSGPGTRAASVRRCHV